MPKRWKGHFPTVFHLGFDIWIVDDETIFKKRQHIFKPFGRFSQKRVGKVLGLPKYYWRFGTIEWLLDVVGQVQRADGQY